MLLRLTDHLWSSRTVVAQFDVDGRFKVTRQVETWFELDQFLKTKFTHESGQELAIECVTVDTGGQFTEESYKYVGARLGRHVFAIKGGGDQGKPLVGRPSKHNRYRVPLFVLCVDTGKETVYSRLRIGSPGPGYMHRPDWIDAEYLAQLTAEKAIRKYVKGRGAVKEWVKLRERNEALDAEVYCLAALYILGPAFVKGLPGRAARFSLKAGGGDNVGFTADWGSSLTELHSAWNSLPW